MSFLLQSNPVKPNRLSTGDKDVQYHLDYAKWAVSNGFNAQHQEWLDRIEDNKRFYKNDQWYREEDIENFLTDSTGQARNRSALTNNIIRPMIEQFRGNAILLKINASARNYSPKAINRRTQKLEEQLLKTDVANEFPVIGEMMRSQDMSIGSDRDETNIIFNNIYVDEYVEQINTLMKHVKTLNEFQTMQIHLAQNLALTGLCCVEDFEHGGQQRFQVKESNRCIWDRDARKFDLSDASFVGYWDSIDPSWALERYQISDEDALALENYVTLANQGQLNFDSTENENINTYRVPAYTMYWKDCDYFEYGYVMDEYGYPFLTRINFIYPGEEEPKYTDKDLIDPPKSVKNDKLFKGKKKRKLFADYLRFCTFVPGDIIPSNTNPKEKYGDIVLDWGIVEYQEVDLQNISNVKYPLKFQTWGYVDGDVFSPVDDAINPQRFINRIISVTDQQINNSGGAGAVIDEDAIPPGREAEVYNDMKEGKPVTIRTKGKGVPNTIGYYDNTPKQGTYSMFSIIPLIKQMVQDTTGINEALKGESTGSDQLVGVTQLLLQRGSLMQEPFYEAISNIFLQMYQSISTRGKRIYIDNETELVEILGDEGARVVKLSEDLKNEDINVFVERENDDDILKQSANNMLLVFSERGLISQEIFARLFNRSTPNEVTFEMRKYAKIQAENQRRQAMLAQQQMEQQQLQLAAQQQQQRADNMAMAQQNAGLEERRQNIDLVKSLSQQQERNTQNVAQ